MRRLLLPIALAWPMFGVGAGTYCVTPTGSVPSPNPHNCAAGKTFPKVGLAYAALVTDQGATPFTATQNIFVSSGGTYPAMGSLGTLVPTATYRLNIVADTVVQPFGGAAGQPKIDCGGSSIDNATIYTGFTTISGFDIGNCGKAFQWGTGGDRSHDEISYNYIHDLPTAYAALYYNSATYVTNNRIHHNYFVNVVRGLYVLASAVTVEFNEFNTTTGGNMVTSSGSWTVRNNIGYHAYVTLGSFILAGAGDLDTGNVGYANRYCTQGGAGTVGTVISNNICVANIWTCHYEAGAGAAAGVTQHSFCYRGTVPGGATGGQVMRMSGSPASGWTSAEINNICWPNQTVSSGDGGLYSLATTTGAMSDYNVYWLTGTPGAHAIANVAGISYKTLAAAKASGMETHSINVNPRIVGDPDLLATTSQVYPECPTIECRLGKIRRNYMPTSLALKGTGCATWTGSCTPDHSDIGPVPITLYDAPGATATMGDVAY